MTVRLCGVSWPLRINSPGRPDDHQAPPPRKSGLRRPRVAPPLPRTVPFVASPTSSPDMASSSSSAFSSPSQSSSILDASSPSTSYGFDPLPQVVSCAEAIDVSDVTAGSRGRREDDLLSPATRKMMRTMTWDSAEDDELEDMIAPWRRKSSKGDLPPLPSASAPRKGSKGGRKPSLAAVGGGYKEHPYFPGMAWKRHSQFSPTSATSPPSPATMPLAPRSAMAPSSSSSSSTLRRSSLIPSAEASSASPEYRIALDRKKPPLSASSCGSSSRRRSSAGVPSLLSTSPTSSSSHQHHHRHPPSAFSDAVTSSSSGGVDYAYDPTFRFGTCAGSEVHPRAGSSFPPLSSSSSRKNSSVQEEAMDDVTPTTSTAAVGLGMPILPPPRRYSEGRRGSRGSVGR